MCKTTPLEMSLQIARLAKIFVEVKDLKAWIQTLLDKNDLNYIKLFGTRFAII